MIKIYKHMPSRNFGKKITKKQNMFGISTNVHARIWDEFGNLTYDEDCGHNTIANDDLDTGTSLNNGLVWMAERLFPQGASKYDVADGVATDDADLSTVELGVGTASNSGLGSAVAQSTKITVTAGNTNLTTATTGSGDAATTTSVTMTLSCIWNSSNYNYALSGITEIVLLTNANEKLFAYKNSLGSLSKTAGGTLQIDWAFTFSQV